MSCCMLAAGASSSEWCRSMFPQPACMTSTLPDMFSCVSSQHCISQLMVLLFPAEPGHLLHLEEDSATWSLYSHCFMHR